MRDQSRWGRTSWSEKLGLRVMVGAVTLMVGVAERARAGEAYALSVNSPGSGTTYSFTLSAPFAGTLVGENDAAKPAAQQTRTKRMASLFSCGTFGATQNDPINISGSVSASGASPTPTNLLPGGSLTLGFDAASGSSFVRGLNLQLLTSGSVSVAASLGGFSYQSFCTVNPGCNAPFLFTPPPIPLGSIGVTAIGLAQDAGDAIGTLTPVGPDAFTIAIPLTVTASVAASFSGAAVPIDPQVLPLVLSGTITRTPSGASFTTALNFTITPPTNQTPTALPPVPVMLPSDSILCPGINLILGLTVSNVTFTSTAEATLNAGGPRLACPCDADASGTIGVQDIFEFLTRWFSGDPRANFNGVGGLTVQDVFDFLTCWFAPPREC